MMPGEVMRCQALPGCRPALALCMTDKDCCSGGCEPTPEGPRRCARASGCQPEQERCADGADCCSGVCMAGPEGIGRCAKAPGMKMRGPCRGLGELCDKAGDCCEAEACGPDADGHARCLPAATGCLASGFPCLVGAQCCGGQCLPDAVGGFSCAAACAPTGAACRASIDCCAGRCLGPPGASVCVPLDPAAPGPVCAGPGTACGESLCCADALCAVVPAGGTVCALGAGR
jgi:hypothetical protein